MLIMTTAYSNYENNNYDRLVYISVVTSSSISNINSRKYTMSICYYKKNNNSHI